jgi:hypothetical protein
MDWLALLFNMRGTYQLCSVFEEGVLAHQSIRLYNGRNWTDKNVLQRRNQLRKISSGGHFSSGQQLHCRARNRAIQVSQGKGIGRHNGKTSLPVRETLDGLVEDQGAATTGVVIGGFTECKGSRKQFEALLLGAYEDGKFRYFGHPGSGFSAASL